MVIKVLKTYRGKHGLYVQGQVYDLTKNQIALISDDCEQRREAFLFEAVKDANQINKPAKKQAKTPGDKQTEPNKTK